ncbi:tyrosine-type recombinase/integrase [Morganella morganii]|uniref:Integrase arm-type DNA-binding domain-containing protein n=1 Tax=Morganella morganii TaxID=582 RepID=A0AAI9MV48_MORMO|nr:integrase arm-type DNA-binding domain-containing protein [Morganella morganii]
MPLNVKQIEALKPRDKSYKVSDGGSLYLEITPRGSKYWRMKYRRPEDKKEDRLAFGVWPAVSLAEARAKRDEAKKLLTNGIDPKAEQKGAQLEAQGAFTFSHVAKEWISKQKNWSADHSARVLRYLDLYIFPAIGNTDIRKLKTIHLLTPVKAIDDSGKNDVAKRMRQKITAIMRYAVQNGIIESNPALDMAGALATTKVKHHPALPPDRFPELLSRIETFEGREITRIAIEFGLLTFIRSSELRFARWSEFDFERAVWVIPGKREEIDNVRFSDRGMKMKTPHVVPLSHQAVTLLNRLKNYSGDCLGLFPGDRDPSKFMSEGTINKALRSMKYDTKTEVCHHGFRTMARGAMGESGLWSDDVIERQLSHMERNNVKAAYLHTSHYLDERRLMVQWWADYLDANRKGFISPYDFAQSSGRG